MLLVGFGVSRRSGGEVTKVEGGLPAALAGRSVLVNSWAVSCSTSCPNKLVIISVALLTIFNWQSTIINFFISLRSIILLATIGQYRLMLLVYVP